MAQNTNNPNAADDSSELGATFVDVVGLYLHSDGYDKGWSEFTEAEKQYEGSKVASFLFNRIGSEQVPAMQNLLSQIRDNPQHPLVQEASDQAMQSWDDPHYWPDLVDVLEIIDAHLRSLSGQKEQGEQS